MNLVISKCVTAVKVSNFSGHYLRNRSTLDIGVLGYIGIVEHKEHPPEVWHVPPGTPCIEVSSQGMSSKEAGNKSGLYPVKGQLPSPINMVAEPALAKCLRFPRWSSIKEMLHFQSLPSVTCLLRVLSIGALPPYSPHGAAIERERDMLF